jgi:hypothetical protein
LPAKKKKKRALDQSTSAVARNEAKVAKRAEQETAAPALLEPFPALRPYESVASQQRLLEQLLQPPPQQHLLSLPFDAQRNTTLRDWQALPWHGMNSVSPNLERLDALRFASWSHPSSSAWDAALSSLQQSRNDMLLQELMLSQSRAAALSQHRTLSSLLTAPPMVWSAPSNVSLLQQLSQPPPRAVAPPERTTVPMASPADVDHLSQYQVLIRRQLEFFVSQEDDATYSVQGRKKQIHLGQVGIRCRHCSHLPHRLRGRGAGYYPAKLGGVYQAAQNMATNHLNQFCNCIPAAIREELCALRGGRHDSATGGGKQYWANQCHDLGLVEFQDGVYFQSTLSYLVASLPNAAASAPTSST